MVFDHAPALAAKAATATIPIVFTVPEEPAMPVLYPKGGHRDRTHRLHGRADHAVGTPRVNFTSAIVPGLTFPLDVRQKASFFLFGINYRFSTGPVVTKYVIHRRIGSDKGWSAPLRWAILPWDNGSCSIALGKG
jgi:hypothetical protein